MVLNRGVINLNLKNTKSGHSENNLEASRVVMPQGTNTETRKSQCHMSPIIDLLLLACDSDSSAIKLLCIRVG